MDRPTIFSAPMVLAILAGRKTQTRRLAWAGRFKPAIDNEGDIPGFKWGTWQVDPKKYDGATWLYGYMSASPWQAAQPGDRLWVREAWAIPENWGDKSAAALAKSCIEAGYDKPWAPICYTADGQKINWGDWREHAPGKGRPSIHMPRWASRVTLVASQVRVQRLNDITDEDALAEGVVWSDEWNGYVVPGIEHPNKDFPVLSRSTPREMFAALWDAIHGDGQWLANPEVVAMTFSVHAANIDLMGVAHG